MLQPRRRARPLFGSGLSGTGGGSDQRERRGEAPAIGVRPCRVRVNPKSTSRFTGIHARDVPLKLEAARRGGHDPRLRKALTRRRPIPRDLTRGDLCEPIPGARLIGVKKAPLIRPNLAQLLARASVRPMTPEARSRQLVSLAFGNLKLENDRTSRGLIEDAVRVVTAR